MSLSEIASLVAIEESQQWSPPLEQLPRNRAEVYKVFGDPGVGKVDKTWERASMVLARDLPGSWNKNSKKLYVHRLAEPYLRESLRLCEQMGTSVLHSIDQIGCFNFRHQRHDPRRPLSYHAWGIAIDIDPADNAAQTWSTVPPEPWSPGWKKLWPGGISRDVVVAFESVGWKWGGRWRGFVDPMHFELTR
jgi:hypothetical protein